MQLAHPFGKMSLIIWAIGATISFVLQFFLPQLVANASIWDLSVYQQELALISAGFIFAIAYALFLNKVEINKYLTLVLIVFSGIIGTYNLYSLITHGSFALINFFWILGNYVEIGFGIYCLNLNREEGF